MGRIFEISYYLLLIINYTFEKKPTCDDYTVLFVGLSIQPVVLNKIIGIINKLCYYFTNLQNTVYLHTVFRKMVQI